MALVGTKVNVAIEGGLGTSKTISGITLASTGVVTLSSSPVGVSVGDIVKLFITDGMPELDGQIARVTNVSGASFDLEGIDTTLMTPFVSGTLKKISSWSTLSIAQSVSMPDAAMQWIDVTTLIDTVKQYVPGIPDAPDGQIQGLYNPAIAAVGLIKTALLSSTTLGMRITWPGGQKVYVNAYIAGGQGFEMSQNDAAKSTFPFRPVKNAIYFAS